MVEQPVEVPVTTVKEELVEVPVLEQVPILSRADLNVHLASMSPCFALPTLGDPFILSCWHLQLVCKSLV